MDGRGLYILQTLRIPQLPVNKSEPPIHGVSTTKVSDGTPVSSVSPH